MNPQIDLFFSEIGRLSVAYFWQPLVWWTLLALPIWGVLHLLSQVRPQARYTAVSALLYALPLSILIVFSGILPLLFETPIVWDITPNLGSSDTQVALLADTPSFFEQYWALGLGIVTFIAGSLAFYFIGRLISQTFSLHKLHRGLRSMSLQHFRSQTNLDIQALELPSKIRIYFTEANTPPFTLGFFRPMIVLPVALRRDTRALEMAIAHEAAHIRQHDFVRRWLDLLIAGIFYFHPLILQLVSKMEVYREMTCDAHVLQQADTTKKSYATLLYTLAAQPEQATHTYWAPMMAAPSTKQLKQRIEAMKNYQSSDQTSPFYSKWPFGLALVLILSTFVACASDPVTPLESQLSIASNQVLDSADKMPTLVGGLGTIAEAIKYPELAKKAGIEGRVMIEIVVDKTGAVAEATVMKGIGGGCDEEALRVIREVAQFEPGMHEGEPANVRIYVPITFRLSDNHVETETILQ